jgi:ribosomal protein S17E
MKPTRIVELVIQDDNQELAIDAISLVSAPAIEQDFVFFGKEKSNLTLAKVDEEKRMLISPALIPNKNIIRYDANTDSEYYVWFSKETVRKASELYLKHNNHHKATYEHQERVSGVLTVESWIIEDPKMDKANLYGFQLKKGTWMVKMKIDNEELWQDIKSKKIKGLSIEGYFTDKFEAMQKKKALKELLSVQKVDLSINDDINKPLEKARKAFANIEVGLFKASGFAVSAASDFDKAARVAADGVKRAKELGVSSDIIKLFSSRLSEAEFGYKDASSIAKQIQSITSKL